MPTPGFLTEFPPVETGDWESEIRAAVTGQEYPAKLVWHPEEGLAVKPYYRAEDSRDLSFLSAAPGKFPYVRGARPTAEWRIREDVDASDPEQANSLAREAIAAGAEEISFSAAQISLPADLARLLANLENIPLRFQGLAQCSASMAADWLGALRTERQVSADIDPLANLELAAELCCDFSNSRLLSLSAEEYEENGVGAIEQIAFLLSAGAEFLDEMLTRGVSTASAAGRLGFSFSIGPKFFIEVAKLRAFRLAWAKIVQSFDGNSDSAKAVIYARTARWNQTLYDPQVNTLRATTEAMSAIVGGADSILIAPFDQTYRKPDCASRRLARNLQLVLKHEAGLVRVADPLGGAYMIEALTGEIATCAWRLFQDLEAAGGYTRATAAGLIDSIIQRRRTDRSKAASQRKLVLTGTNRYAHPSEKALARIESSVLGGASRVACSFEEIRLRSERYAIKARSPKTVLARFGDPKMSDARAQFAADFLACGGFRTEVRSCRISSEIAEIDSDLVVLCSSDTEYLPAVEELSKIYERQSRKPCLVVAGNPACSHDLKQLGVEEFIHLGSDAPEVLSSIQQKLGIED